MNEMLDLALSINPTQPLERSFRMPDRTFVQTIEEGVAVYKEELSLLQIIGIVLALLTS